MDQALVHFKKELSLQESIKSNKMGYTLQPFCSLVISRCSSGLRSQWPVFIFTVLLLKIMSMISPTACLCVLHFPLKHTGLCMQSSSFLDLIIITFIKQMQICVYLCAFIICYTHSIASSLP